MLPNVRGRICEFSCRGPACETGDAACTPIFEIRIPTSLAFHDHDEVTRVQDVLAVRARHGRQRPSHGARIIRHDQAKNTTTSGEASLSKLRLCTTAWLQLPLVLNPRLLAKAGAETTTTNLTITTNFRYLCTPGNKITHMSCFLVQKSEVQPDKAILVDFGAKIFSATWQSNFGRFLILRRELGVS